MRRSTAVAAREQRLASEDWRAYVWGPQMSAQSTPSSTSTSPPSLTPPRAGGKLAGVGVAALLAAISYAASTLPGLKVVGPLTVALLLGMIARTGIGMPGALVPGVRFSARTLLRLGIVLMGSRLDFGLIADAGPKILAIDVAIIAVGLVGIVWIARRFRVPAKLATLLAVGTSICGASAVVAASSVIKADEEDTTLAVGLCGILGTVGVLGYVFVVPLLGVSITHLAVLSGSTLHEVAQVMAAAFSFGSEAGDLGTLVKLTRVVLLAPTLVLLGIVAGAGGKVSYSWKEPPIPWFVIGFIAVGVISSLGVVPRAALAASTKASVLLMVMAMAAMGMQTPFALVRRAGARVLYAGLLGFGLLAAISALLISLLGV